MSDSPQYPPVPPQAAQSGLSDNAAGALAYVTIIPAIIFLLIEPYNRNSYVRFHSWQCIFLCIASIVFHVAAILIPVAGLFLSPLVTLVFLVLWIIALVKALKGERFQLPVIGKFAAQQAGN